jgi:hypothetical protein
MAALLLLLAIIGGIVVGDLVLENTTVGDVTMLHYTITGYSEGLLLAMAAALGFVLGLLVVVSVSTTRTRRARRKQRRTAGRALHSRMAELERENARLREELARDERVGHLGELASPADLGSTSRAGAMADHRVTAQSDQLVERSSEPLYEEARRAARLRGDSGRLLLSADDRARSWQTAQRVRRS